jgi:hypothetical protein
MLKNPALEFALSSAQLARQSLRATHRVKTKRKVRKLEKQAVIAEGEGGLVSFLRRQQRMSGHLSISSLRVPCHET